MQQKNREISIIYINDESLKLLFGVDKKLWDAQSDLNPRLKGKYIAQKNGRWNFFKLSSQKDTTTKKEVTMPANIRFVRDHPYITSAKGLGGWGQKNGNFC